VSLHKSHRIITGEPLYQALIITAHPVKWLSPGRPDLDIHPQVAAALVKAGVYEGKARPGRVYYIREVDPRPKPVADPRFWEGRGCIRWEGGITPQSLGVWMLYANRQRPQFIKA